MVYILQRLLDSVVVTNILVCKAELHAAISGSILKLVELLNDTSDNLPPRAPMLSPPGELLLITISRTDTRTTNHTVPICP